MLSKKVQNIGFSPTMQISGMAKKMKSEGIDVIDLSVGEPDFPTPDNVKEAAHEAIRQNKTKYTANAGLPDLKKAICERFFLDQKLEYAPDQIIVSSGAKNSIYNICMAIIDPGDEAIIPAPYWVSYPPMVELAGGVPVYVETTEANEFRLTPDALAAAMSPKSKVLFLNNPCNPSGAFYTREQLEPIVKLAVEKNLIIISDEIYDKLVYDGHQAISVAALSPAAKQHALIVNGVSKAYAMTGWRIGYTAGDKEIISAMDKIQSQSTSNACTVSQVATIEALRGPQASVEAMRVEFEKRRNFMHTRLSQLKGVTCVKSQGAFYLFPNFAAYFNTEFNGQAILNSYDLGFYLLKEAHVAVVPGAAFGSENFIRFSYSNSMENIKKALDRIELALRKLTPVK